MHSKQIGLPGGQFEAEDRDLEYTSIRETNEELGVDPDSIKIIGQLSEIYIPPSNFLVKPYVAYMNEFNEFIPDEQEVNRVIKTSLSNLLSLQIEKRDKYIQNGKLKMEVASFIIDQEVVWGATAMMLNEFRTIIKENFSL